MSRKYADPVEVQFLIAVRQKPGTRIPRELLEHALRQYMIGESLPRGMKIKAIAWRNPSRNKAHLRNWRGAGDRASLARLLRGKSFAHVDENPESAKPSLASLALAASISFTVRGDR